MLKARLDWLREPGSVSLLEGGLRGVEKESLRVAPDGRLSLRPHPPALGSALTHPYLTTDYSEALLEFVSPPAATNRSTIGFLGDLHAFVHRRLGDELLWPASMPCIANADDEIPIADYGTSNLGLMKTVYRRGLGLRYGRAMQAIAGVHFNYSPPDAFWAAWRDRAGADEPSERSKSAGLMALARNYRRLSWLVIYLFGASPALCRSFRPEGHELLAALDSHTWHAPYATSLRMSDIGYRNTTQARLNISLNSPEEYIAGLSAAVSTVEPRYEAIGVVVDGEYCQLNAHILQIENEYYTPIRPKPAKGQPDRPVLALRRHGVEYVEVRALDLDPTEPAGIGGPALRFLETLLLYCLLSDSPPIGEGEQREIDARDLAVAREGRKPGLMLPRGSRAVRLRDWGRELLDGMEEIAERLGRGGEDYRGALRAGRRAIEDPDATPSARLVDDLRRSGKSFCARMRELACEHREHFLTLELAPAREAQLVSAAARSLEAQRQLEQDRSRSFDEFLAEYFSQA